MRQLRVILGTKKGIKCRIRYPSQTGGYIQYTCASIAEAKRQKKGLGSWQKRRAVIAQASNNKKIM